MNVPLLLTGATSGLAFALYSALSKSVIKNRVASPFVFLIWVSLFQAVVMGLLWVWIEPAVPDEAGLWPLLAAAGTCFVGYVFLYWALSCGDVSSVMPIMGSKVIFSGVLAQWLLGERHNAQIDVAVLLAAASVAVLSYSPARHRDTPFHVKPVVLMLACCAVFSVTDICIKRSLAHLDAFNFMVYYNAIVGLASLLLIPLLRLRNVPLALDAPGRVLTLLSAICLVVSSLLFVIMFRMAGGIVLPNILISTRGIFIVLIALLFTHRGSTALDEQSAPVYGLRVGASALIILSVFIAVRN